MSQTAKIIIKAIDDASKTFEKIRGEIDKTKKTTDKFASAMQKNNAEQIARQKALAGSFKMVGNVMIAAGALATTALGLAAKSAIDFEDAFAGVRKTVSLGEEEMDGLARSIRDMATEMPVSTNELSKIAEIAGQLGIQTVPELEKFTRVMAKASTAITEVGVEQMSLSFAQIANVMGEPIDNIDRMASVVVELGNKMKTGEQKIFNYSKRLAPVASIVGMTTDQLFGLSAGLASTGIEAEAGSTAVQKAMLFMRQSASGATSTFIDNTKEIGKNTDKLSSLKNKLAVATQKQNEFTDSTKESTKLKISQDIAKYTDEIGGLDGALGILNETNGKMVASQSDFAEIIGVTKAEFAKMREEDPAGTFVKFLEGLKRLEEEGGDAAKVLDDLGLGSARSLKTLLASANTAEEIAKGLNLASAEMENNNALNTEYGKRLETTASQMVIFKQNINEVGITIGSALLPAINNIVQALIPFIQGFAKFADENPKVVVGILATIAALGGFVIAVRTINAVVGAIKLAGLAMGFSTVTAAVTALFGALSVIIPIIMGVVTIGTGLALIFDDIAMRTGITTERFEGIHNAMINGKAAWESVTTFATNLKDKLFGVRDGNKAIQISEEELATGRNTAINLNNSFLKAQQDIIDKKKRVQGANEDLREAERLYGADSDQYAEAQLKKEIADSDLTISRVAADEAADALRKQNEKIIEQEKPMVKSIENTDDAVKKSTGLVWKFSEAWWDVGAAIKRWSEGNNLGGGEGGATGATGSFAHGGVIPGAIDEPVPIIAHGGERVIPRTGMDAQGGSSGGTGGISISFNGPVNIDSEERVEKLAQMIEERLGRQNELARYGVGF